MWESSYLGRKNRGQSGKPNSPERKPSFAVISDPNVFAPVKLLIVQRRVLRRPKHYFIWDRNISTAERERLVDSLKLMVDISRKVICAPKCDRLISFDSR